MSRIQTSDACKKVEEGQQMSPLPSVPAREASCKKMPPDRKPREVLTLPIYPCGSHGLQNDAESTANSTYSFYGPGELRRYSPGGKAYYSPHGIAARFYHPEAGSINPGARSRFLVAIYYSRRRNPEGTTPGGTDVCPRSTPAQGEIYGAGSRRNLGPSSVDK